MEVKTNAVNLDQFLFWQVVPNNIIHDGLIMQATIFWWLSWCKDNLAVHIWHKNLWRQSSHLVPGSRVLFRCLKEM